MRRRSYRLGQESRTAKTRRCRLTVSAASPRKTHFQFRCSPCSRERAPPALIRFSAGSKPFFMGDAAIEILRENARLMSGIDKSRLSL